MKKTTVPQSLSLLVKPASYLCNISCEYCFYQRVHDLYHDGSLKMNSAMLEVVIKKTLAAGAAINSICWQGGEPLLMGLDFFREAVALQKKYAKPGQIIENSIQTNGLLLNDAWCEFFRNEHFLVGISLDGPYRIHDHYRKNHKNEGTFHEVMQGIALMKAHDVQFNILCLLTDQNIKLPLELYDFFRSHDFRFLQFINCFESDNTTGIWKEFSVRGRETGEFYIKLFDHWYKNDFFDVSIRFFEDILLYLVDGVKASCCYNHTCGSYVVVEHNGDCYPCDFFVAEEWKIGNLGNSDIMTIMNSPLNAEFAAMKSDIPNECIACALLPFCQGDCTRFRYRRDSGFANTSEYCTAIKMVYNHIKPHLPEIRNRVAAFRGSQS